MTDSGVEGILQRFRDEVTMLQEEPAFKWGAGKVICAVAGTRRPDAVATSNAQRRALTS